MVGFSPRIRCRRLFHIERLQRKLVDRVYGICLQYLRFGAIFVLGLEIICSHAASAQAISRTPAPTASSRPDDIYFAALARLKNLPSAPYLDYVMRQVNTNQDGAVVLALDEDVHERRSDRSFFNLITAAVPRANAGRVLIGRHYIIPDAFLPFASTAPVGMLPNLDEEGSSPDVIATVHSLSNYRIVLDEVVSLQGCGEAFHLSLTPLRDPDRYNVRDLWIRTDDYMLCKAIYNSHLYDDDPWHPWSVF